MYCTVAFAPTCDRLGFYAEIQIIIGTVQRAPFMYFVLIDLYWRSCEVAAQVSYLPGASLQSFYKPVFRKEIA